MNSITFSAAQLVELGDLNVTREQIDALALLVGVVAPLFRLEAPPKMADVRDEMTSLQAALGDAHNRVFKMLNLNVPAVAAVRGLLAGGLAFTDTGALEPTGFTTMNRLLATLAEAIKVVDLSATHLPKGQSRGAMTPRFAVQWIDAALMSGWNLSQQAAVGKPVDPDADSRLANANGYPFKPSTYWDSRFRKVVDICYRAMQGIEDVSTERAIKNYMAKVRRGFRPLGKSEKTAFDMVIADKTGRQLRISST